MNTERIYDMLVIGGGPAGYTAASMGREQALILSY